MSSLSPIRSRLASSPRPCFTEVTGIKPLSGVTGRVFAFLHFLRNIDGIEPPLIASKAIALPLGDMLMNLVRTCATSSVVSHYADNMLHAPYPFIPLRTTSNTHHDFCTARTAQLPLACTVQLVTAKSSPYDYPLILTEWLFGMKSRARRYR